MLLTMWQYDALFGKRVANARSSGPLEITDWTELWDVPVPDENTYRWGKCFNNQKCVGVPYDLYPSGDPKAFTKKQLEKIKLAMDEIELNTCIR